MLRRVVEVMQFKLDEKNITFSMHVDSGIPYTILSDEQRLAQVIMNLLSNAVKFTPESGNITLHADVADNENDDYKLRVSVKDSGIGISPEHKPRLFKVFSQADSSISRQYGGTGLGLVISKNIVNMMGGDIWFDSVEGEGTTFYFTMETIAGKKKVPDTEDELDNSHGKGRKKDNEAANNFSGKTIMIVDDVEINREILISLLEPTNIHIICAENGKDAIDKLLASQEPIDLIFMDVQMPIMDGYEAAIRIRTSGRNDSLNIPIIAMTANVFKEDVQRCIASGMNDHIGKPISIEDTIEKIKQWT